MTCARRNCALLFFGVALAISAGIPAEGQFSQLVGADGETIFSASFLQEYRAAVKKAEETRSMEPLLNLLETRKRPEEVAELELTMGLLYGQRTGLVDYPKSIVHLTKALKYELPERMRLQSLVWRSGSYFITKDYARAVQDCLRVLLAVSYHDLSSPAAQHKDSPVAIINLSGDPENDQRRDDYARYRAASDLQTALLLYRYHAIETIRESQKGAGISSAQIEKWLSELSPDGTRHKIIEDWLKADNKWPF